MDCDQNVTFTEATEIWFSLRSRVSLCMSAISARHSCHTYFTSLTFFFPSLSLCKSICFSTTFFIPSFTGNSYLILTYLFSFFTFVIRYFSFPSWLFPFRTLLLNKADYAFLSFILPSY